MSEGFIKAICFKEALFAWTTFLQIILVKRSLQELLQYSLYRLAGITFHWQSHIFFSQLWTEAYTKYQRLVKRLYLLQSVSIKTEEYITLTGSKYIICSLMFFLFKKKPLQSLMFKQRHRKKSVYSLSQVIYSKNYRDSIHSIGPSTSIY